jgi:hypothetical protein
MTVAQVADLLHARAIGTRRWAAKCPAHDDRSPSLSIGEGTDGRVVLICRAGCDTPAVLSAAGLSWRDLFSGPPPTPAQAAEAQRKQAEAERQAQADRAGRRRAVECERRWRAVVEALGAKLTNDLESDPLASLFHSACDRLHAAEMEADKWDPPKRRLIVEEVDAQ